MSETFNSCPKCGATMTALAGGLDYCPSCGFAGEQPKPEPDLASRKISRALFWVLLFLPAMLGLASFAVGSVSRQTGAAIGVVALIVGGLASIYCGWWLAEHCCKDRSARWLVGIACGIGL